MRKLILFTLLPIGLAFALPGASAQARGLRAPGLVSPANGARVQQLPAITWNSVRGAASYEFQIAADPKFNSLQLGKGTGRGTARIYNLAATLAKTVPDGTYYWRVRALTKHDKVGAWSRTRKIVKRWSTAPQLTAGNGATVSWPSQPLIFRWSSVAYANKYIVSVATDPGLANLVIGTRTKPLETQGVNFAMPTSLAPGTYYWAITPVDAEGRHGQRSAVGTFQWAWPSSTTTSVSDLNPEAGIFDDPIFSWNPVPGAARYEVEVNSAQSFAPGSKWCCSGTTIGTSLAPVAVLANNRYYWRVRALDAHGNAGVWNEGQPFEKTFDPTTPTVRNLVLRNAEGEVIGGMPSTDTPIVTWDPTPGASLYEVQVGSYVSGLGCDFSKSATTASLHSTTATTAWTPLGRNGAGHQGPAAWPTPQQQSLTLPAGGASYCLRVLARTDEDAQRNQVVSAWTQINGVNKPAFTYLDPPAPGSPGSEGLVTSGSDYIAPHPGFQPGCQERGGGATPGIANCSLTPLFTWKRVAGASGYFVVVARDPRFTEVADVGYTNVPAYAARVANDAPLADETTDYYWAVVPTSGETGSGVFSSPCFTTPTNPCEGANDNPQRFDKSSSPPAPLSPGAGSEVTSQPSFRWSLADNARSYELQVAADPSFAKPIDDVKTDATGYTSNTTYPADTALYWRVRANDWSGHGLNWSPTESFVRRLPVPTLGPLGATTIFGPPPVAWSPVQGAIEYETRVEQGDGKVESGSVETPSFSATKYYGAGIVHVQVRAIFPTSAATKVTGGFSASQPLLLLLSAPRGARGTKTGSRLLVTWHPEPDAKQYEVEVAKSNGFNSRLEARRVDGSSWAPSIDLSAKRNRGTLYWRVAPVDQRGGVGSFTSGAFTSGHPARTKCPKGKVRKHGRCRRR
jgi:hypothetical protein